MKTFEDLILLYTQKLKQQNIHRPRRVVEEVISSVVDIPRCDIFNYYEKKLEASLRAKIKRRLDRILKKDLIEYVIGHVEFFNCYIKVNSSVLVPRQETELLMDIFVNSTSCAMEGKNIFDICCGSGCLAIAAKKKFPLANVYASDVSSTALKTAIKNAKNNNIDANFFKGSLFKPYKNLKADYILCNPPYLSKKEFDEVNNTQEPSIALIGGETGLEFYEKIASELLKYVNPKAKIFFEIGYLQGERVKKIFEKIPHRKCALLKDFAGYNRFFFLEIE